MRQRAICFALLASIVPLVPLACTPEERTYGDECTNSSDCMACCYDRYYQQQVTLDKWIYQTCGCHPDATCASNCIDSQSGSCAPFDNLPDPCSGCLFGTVTTTDPCYQMAIGSCKDDANCVPFYDCKLSCGG